MASGGVGTTLTRLGEKSAGQSNMNGNTAAVTEYTAMLL